MPTVPVSNNVIPMRPQGGAAPSPTMLAMAAAIMHAIDGGRDRGQRAFYNATRAGLFNSTTAPETGSTYGGLGMGLKDRRALQGFEAQDIEDKFFGDKK